ncbi:hypothetical protein INT45_010926 [Circinella minor]|uniref:Tc1-like transposase DDE domain-containing protein n=1 Tax=Circinella minor TaxID=1195481 RepID=A0A8H7V736_9FUNG|nr:hypothetical protein INT45_010926 [Circinella minor]
MKINDTKQTVYSNKSPTIADEDTAMDIIESIDFVNEENIDHESSQFSFSFSAETARLVQENDIISDTDDDTDSESSSILDGDGDDDEMPNNKDDMYQLRSIAPDTNVVAAATETVSVQPQKNKVNKPLPKNRRGKYTYHSPDIMKQALVLKAAGGSYRKISALMNIPRGTIHEHKKRAQTRKGKANPIKHKRVMPSKITENGGRFLLQSVTDNNTITLDQLQRGYFQKFGIRLAASTIYRYLVYKCRMTIKRAYPYPERRTDDDTKNFRVQFVKNYIETKILDYKHNCVFVDEASVMANMRRNYAWSAAGEVAHVKVPQMYTCSRSMLAVITYTGIVEVCLKINKVGQGGGTKSRDFYAFLNLVMDKLDGRNLKYKGWNIICDNAPIHTAHYIANRVSERGYKLVLLPRYSPFLNPIENFFSKVKLLFRHIDDNTNFIEQTSENQTEDLEQRLTSSLAKVTLSDYAGWVNHSITYFNRCLAREHDL